MEEYKEFEFFRGKVRFKQPKGHRFSIVEVLFVANLKGIKRNCKVVDLGAGFGTLSILTALKYGCEVWAVERDPQMLDLLKYNIEVNNLKNRVHIIDMDLRNIKKSSLSFYSFHMVIANPPFYRGSSHGNIYHHETDTTFEDFIRSGSFLLKDGGGFNLLMASNRFIEAIDCMKSYNLNVSIVRIFYPKLEKNGKIVHIFAVKNLKPQLVIEKPLIINENNGEYTQEVRCILDSFL